MKKAIAFILIILSLACIAKAEMYKLENVKRIESNLYKADGGFIIKTQSCYHYTYGEDAIYDDDDKKIIWKDGDSPCDVKGIYK